MNTNALKRFAREARIKLIDQVGRKLEFVLSNTEPVFIDTNASQIQSLKNKIQAQGKEQVIDTVAYTWFNRLMALRFMDANGYTSPKVVTPVVGKSPEILQNALSGQIDEALKINRQRLNDLLDGKVVIADAQTEAYKMLLIAACNQWHTAMPFMFERISDYTELLLPDDLLSGNSIITDIRNGMSDEDCGQEELIGWLYQFYIADKKDDVFEGLKKNIKITAENIPAATQLFTPRWIVRYMVENTLGKLWLTLKPNSKLRLFMPYYIEAPEGNTPAPLPEGIKGVTDITFLDPCQGSGHVLVYAFDLFTKIYEEEGYNTNEIPALILEHNLFGIDIDERAAQLAAFALTMKARSYFPRFLRKPSQPNVIALENVSDYTIRQSIKLPITINGNKISEHKELSLNLLTQADNFGSLIQIAPEELKALELNEGSILAGQQQKLKTQAQYLSRQYHCVVTNPPYMGDKNMNSDLSNYIKRNFILSKSDLFACFIERQKRFSSKFGYLGAINQHSWMFLSSYEGLRRNILEQDNIVSLVHLGPRAFPEINGEKVQSVAYVLQSENISINNNSTYIRLTDFKDPILKENNFSNKNHYYNTKSNEFLKIPGFPIAYWVADRFISVFKESKAFNITNEIKSGILSGNDPIFVRNWQEVSQDNAAFNLSNLSEFTKINAKWIPITNGGKFRRWYGNYINVINLKNGGEDIQTLERNNHRLRDNKYYFKKGINWTLFLSGKFSVRLSPSNILFGNGSRTVFPSEYFNFFFGLLNSKVSESYLSFFNPTANFNNEDIAIIPVIYKFSENINDIVDRCVQISKKDWDSYESSWNFLKSPLLLNVTGINIKVKDSLKLFIDDRKSDLFELQKAEEQINTYFINLYELDNVINQFVELKDVTILENIKIVNGSNVEFNIVEIFGQFISYSVGCIFGRYSLDNPSLILANQGETLQDFQKQVPNPSFMPDEDNIIPILEGEWFNDDIVGRFKVFLKAAFGEEHFEENLKYIEDTIGKDIRKYFVKDFYNDHIKRYKKRPIYWMFSSPKGHFKVLIYMHRYTPDLCSKMLTDYLQSYINKLEAAQQNKIAESLREDLPARDKTAATKEADRYSVMIKDCKEYAQTLYAVATKKITIDLDDGVKANYQKFKEVLVPIKGLEKDEE